MKAKRVQMTDDALLDVDSPTWKEAETAGVEMAATPLALTAEASPFLAISDDHGAIKKLEVSALHNGKLIAVRLKWKSDKHDKIADLDSFLDGAAVIFPVARGASAVTMGAKNKPTNAWYWRAGRSKPFEVIARGFKSVQRIKDESASDLTASSVHRNGEWEVILRRSLGTKEGLVKLKAGGASKIAFAVWDGGNTERSGRKSFSGEFVDFEILK